MSVVRYSDAELTDIVDRTDGCCHLCFVRLAFVNYGRLGARGAWEVEHSVPRAHGGTNPGTAATTKPRCPSSSGAVVDLASQSWSAMQRWSSTICSVVRQERSASP